jgi:ketosteroid isomerase-like protein
MKRLLFGTAMIMMLAFTAFGQKGAVGKVDPSKGVRDAFDRLIEGIKEVDVDKVMSVYEKGPKLLIFNNNGTATSGWDNVKANVTAAYVKATNVTIDVTGVHVEMLGTKAAYVTCKWKQSQDFDGKLESSSGRMTLVFKLIGKDWKITHRHTSPDKPDATRPVLPSERETEAPK